MKKIAHDTFFQNMVMASSSFSLCPNYFAYTFNTLAPSVLKGSPDSFKTWPENCWGTSVPGLQGLHGFAMLFTANFALGQWIRWIINKHLETLGTRYRWSWAPCKRFTDRSKVFIYGEDPRLTPRFAINCVTLGTPHSLWASPLSATLCCPCRLKNSHDFKQS